AGSPPWLPSERAGDGRAGEGFMPWVDDEIRRSGCGST
uniref:Uncharacterized protein n=1 Tax=Aegilops tauschii subsp. strangulata TaxID=200361 RepID=A0A453J5K3_AEGTS